MEAGEPAVSVVVATFNRASRLGALFDGLRAQRAAGVPFEVIVVDDCSSDATPTLLKAEVERGELPLRTLRLERNGGPAGAREAGWRAARAPVIAFTDDDCRPAEGWLAAGLAAIQGDRGEGGTIVQGRTEPDPTQLDRRGPFSRTIEVTEPDPGFQTCNVFYPRELLERVGGFELTIGRPGGEDSDLAWRAIETGARARFEPGALVFHEVADLGPVGKLRVAARWTDGMVAYVRHPELRRAHFHNWLFWKRTHLQLLRVVLGLSLRGRWRLLYPWLVFPYVRTLWARGKLEGGGPLLAPYYALYDLVEIWAVLRAAIRFRRPML